MSVSLFVHIVELYIEFFCTLSYVQYTFVFYIL